MKRPGGSTTNVETETIQPRRFERFEPVTVRAAARVIRISWLGRVTTAEVRCYLQHLADLQPGHAYGAVHRLGRLGRWRAAMGDRGVPYAFRLRRSARPMPGSYVSLERTPTGADGARSLRGRRA